MDFVHDFFLETQELSQVREADRVLGCPLRLLG